MSFIGTVGVVAQQGNQGAATPTSVSLATSSSGNYDQACILASMDDGGVPPVPFMSEDGSNFSASAINISIARPLYQNVLTANSGEIKVQVYCYLRATNATSYLTQITNLDITNIDSGNYTSIAIAGSDDTDQDNTGSNGIDHYIAINHPSGGRGYEMPDIDVYLSFNVPATATNSAGSTAATTLDIRLTWVA
jgi:hypothetical protein